MDKLKLIFIGLGIIFTAILLYFAVTLVIGLFFYLVVFGVIALCGYGAYKFLRRSNKLPQLEESKTDHQLADSQKVLEDYRRKLESGR